MRVLLAVVLGLVMSSAASGAQEETSGRECFNSATWRGWTPTPEGNALYLRMDGGDVFLVEVNGRVRRHAGEFLVNQVRGSSWICSPLDLDLAISDDNGFSRPIIATGLRKLTAEEVAAIAPDDRPY